MAFVIDHAFEIDAPAERVWSIVTDFARYREWNPFVVECSSSLEVGTPITMRVHVFPAFAQSQTETILEHQPGELLCYGIPGLPLGALKSRRSHRVASLGASRARYESHFEISGWLGPLVKALLGGRLASGFGAMSAALEARARGA